MRRVNEKNGTGEGSNALPYIASEWAKGRDTVRIAITEYNGRQCLDCDIWYTNDAGELKPSPKGLTLQLDALPKLAKAVQAALAFANKSGLLLEGGGK